MRHKLAGRKLSRNTAHRMSMLRTMTTDLIRHESIKTTDAKAREVKRMVEKVITHGKKGTLHNRRQASAILTDTKVLHKVFEDLAVRYASRDGGYTRMVKIGPRAGDAAEMAVVELMPS